MQEEAKEIKTEELEVVKESADQSTREKHDPFKDMPPWYQDHAWGYGICGF